MKKEDILVFDEPFLRANESLLLDKATMEQLIIKHAYFTPRESAETDVTKKQIIPYIVLKRNSQYFCTERLKGGTEARLHNKLSIGMGGHVNPVDEATMPGNSVLACMKRELTEEVGYECTQDRFQFIGLINRYENEVEKVHVGVAFLLHLLPHEEIAVKETTKLVGSWVSKEALQKNYDRLEGWSQLVLDKFLPED